MKFKNYLFSVLFAFLGVFFGSFIINQNNTYAETQTVTFTNGSYIPPNDFGFDLSKFNSSPLYFSYSCDRSSNGDNNMYVRVQLGDGNSFIVYCFQTSSAKIVSGMYVLDYVPNGGFGPWSGTNVGGINSWTFTLSDEPPTGSGSTPSGSLEITENGTYDVTDYAEAVVDIPQSSGGGNYHDDLMKIYNAIILCAGTVLVLYFFYCIYRMFIKSIWGNK